MTKKVSFKNIAVIYYVESYKKDNYEQCFRRYDNEEKNIDKIEKNDHIFKNLVSMIGCWAYIF